MKFSNALFLLLSSALALNATPVTISDNTTASLSALLTAQPGLKFSEVQFKGSLFLANSTPTAILLVDQIKIFTATTGTADQRLVIDYAASGIASGGIRLASGAMLTVQGNTTSTDIGGAIYVNTGAILSLRATDSTSSYVFSGNSAQSGGAISNGIAAKTTIENATFSGNSALGGGAISNAANNSTNYGEMTLTNVAFNGNSANGGGAITNADYGRMTLIGATFSNNIAIADSVDPSKKSAGGAISNAGKLFLTDVSFSGNSAKNWGGAIHNKSVPSSTVAAVTLNNASFTGNSTSGGGPFYEGGGAIYNESGTITVTSGSFTSNTSATAGGAVYSNLGTVTFTDTSFSKNSAATSGGAIHLESATLNLNVTQNQTALFAGNVAGGSANSIRISYSGTVAVNTEAGSVLDMRDPFSVGLSGTSANISKSGAGTWKLGGSNASIGGTTKMTVTGGTLYLYAAGEVDNATTSNASATVAAGSISLIGSTSLFGGGSNPSAFTLGNGATVIAGGINSITTTGAITLEGGSIVRGGTGTTKLTLSGSSVTLGSTAGDVVTFDSAVGNSFTVSGTLAGSGGFTKTGAGSVLLQGVSTYAGPTVVQAGILKTDTGAALASSSYSVTTGATLDLSSGVQAFSGKSFSVGLSQSDSGKIVTAASQTFSSSTLTLDFKAANLDALTAGAQWDLFDGSSLATFTGVSLLSGVQSTSFIWSAETALWTVSIVNGPSFSFDQATGLLAVTSAVPEPATYTALAGLFALILTATVRRKRTTL